jgi:DNA-binding transcriptional ArsR family regulator
MSPEPAPPYDPIMVSEEVEPEERERRPGWLTDQLAGDLRDIRDPTVMRALAHPTRLALLETLTVHGPMTATQASDYVDESPSSCSFHLRTLARHGFVEETGEGTGRQRPWRMVQLGNRIHPGNDAGTRAAADALADLYLDRQLARFRRARAEAPSLPEAWRGVTSASEMVTWLTPAEAQQLEDEVMTLLVRYRERLGDPALRPPDSRPVETVYLTYPTEFRAAPPT